MRLGAMGVNRNMQTITITFIISITLIILAFDAYALHKSSKTEYTISYIIAKSAFKNPIIPFAFGVLMGHFFFFQCVL